MDKSIFATRLKKLRNIRDMTQKTLSQMIQINTRTYRDYESIKNKTFPSLEKLIMIADIFNVSTDYLLGRTDNDILQ